MPKFTDQFRNKALIISLLIFYPVLGHFPYEACRGHFAVFFQASSFHFSFRKAASEPISFSASGSFL
jgi:hypothetical protein